MGNERLTFDNDAGVGANDEIIDVPRGAAVKKDAGKAAPAPAAKPGGTPPGGEATATPELIFENELGVSAKTEVIDVFQDAGEKAAHAEFISAIGGAAAMPAAQQDLQEALALMGNDPEELGDLSPAEVNEVLLGELKSYREALASPKEARAVLNRLWSNPNSPVMKAYIHGRDPNITEAITRLQQASCGERPTGRDKRKIEGRTY